MAQNLIDGDSFEFVPGIGRSEEVGVIKTTLFEDENGYSTTGTTFLTADPSEYNHFEVTLQHGTAVVFPNILSEGTYTGGSVFTTGVNDVRMETVSLNVDSSNHWQLSACYTWYHEFVSGTDFSSFTNGSIYKIVGVKYATIN